MTLENLSHHSEINDSKSFLNGSVHSTIIEKIRHGPSSLHSGDRFQFLWLNGGCSC